jgi:tetratricopeptide (TPR) repeat protein
MLSWIPPHALDMRRSKSLSAEALALAQQLGTPSALQHALHARLYALSGPDDIDALLATAEALLATPDERWPWVAIDALLASYRAHLYRCDLVAADATLDSLGQIARDCGLAEAVWYHDFFQAQRVFSRGELARSEALFAELSTRGARLQLVQEPLLSSVASALLTFERDGLAALTRAPNLDGLLAGMLALPPGYAATGARLAAELGRTELARQKLHQLAQHDFEPIVRDLGYVNALANLSVAAIALGDRAQVGAIYELLAPYPNHNTPSGVIGFFEGSASRFLAGAAAFLGEHKRAERHFEDALGLNERTGLLSQVAHTCYDYASWLMQQGRRAAALALKARALELAERLGMRGVAERARAL